MTRRLLGQRGTQAEAAGQLQALAAGAARVACCGCCVRQQLEASRSRSSVRRRLLGQRGTQAEVAGAAAGVGCGRSSSRLLLALRAAAARESRCRGSVYRGTKAAWSVRDAGTGCRISFGRRLLEPDLPWAGRCEQQLLWAVAAGAA